MTAYEELPAAVQLRGERRVRGKRGDHVRGKRAGVRNQNLLPVNTKLGGRLRELRLAANLTTADMADQLGYSGAANGRVSEYELGSHLPSLTILQRYAVAFDTTVSALLDGVM